jgi:hypothetical protein
MNPLKCVWHRDLQISIHTGAQPVRSNRINFHLTQPNTHTSFLLPSTMYTHKLKGFMNKQNPICKVNFNHSTSLDGQRDRCDRFHSSTVSISRRKSRSFFKTDSTLPIDSLSSNVFRKPIPNDTEYPAGLESFIICGMIIFYMPASNSLAKLRCAGTNFHDT